MAMVSMKQSAQESEKQEATLMADSPQYPYGLSISLEKEQLDKLGITALPEVGAEMMIMARCKVESVSEAEYQSGKEKHISLQITDMEVGPAASQSEDNATKATLLYGNQGGK